MGAETSLRGKCLGEEEPAYQGVVFENLQKFQEPKPHYFLNTKAHLL
jgi:hypothetical protein